MKLKLESERLLFRNLEDNDLDDFLFYRSNPEVTRYQSFEPYSRAAAFQFITSQKETEFGVPGQWLQLGIINKKNNQLIGDCAVKLDEYDPRIAEIGCTISPASQHNGFARETILTLMRFLFIVQDVHRILETTDAENIPSIKLLESLGFRKEGHFIENIWFKGKWGSECQYAMLRSEWKEKEND